MAELGWTLPVIGRFHEGVTKLLLETLDECAIGQYWQTHPEFLLWVTVVGGLAARQGPRVSSFVAKLRHSNVVPEKDSWSYVKGVAQKFLPLDYQLGDLCHAFWDEACELFSMNQSPVATSIANHQQGGNVSTAHENRSGHGLAHDRNTKSCWTSSTSPGLSSYAHCHP
ncbi:uncharacterized protein Z519_09559 [Cladophialophora bantiana CBS 173.52]|uniref:Uncharacterized protein n=1 Tax=Cladophialophora bantiana (strain ATCC 10958 / CBS 173.52 / CDC B-1940 / NIH 8579) TaxID=1442370 RepID=A0A0D2HA68_CLAB1|nr:uncharacterized protein Z519_09559 [Cladophialophora bantiana CBS 173.52]KIW90128.1 hypothetical protein Z519_09559 [Cladophialophora bantiana CBS 173.52]